MLARSVIQARYRPTACWLGTCHPCGVMRLFDLAGQPPRLACRISAYAGAARDAKGSSDDLSTLAIITVQQPTARSRQ